MKKNDLTIAEKVRAYNLAKKEAEQANEQTAKEPSTMNEMAIGAHLNGEGKWVVTVIKYNAITGEGKVDFSKICDDRGTAIEQMKIYTVNHQPIFQ